MQEKKPLEQDIARLTEVLKAFMNVNEYCRSLSKEDKADLLQDAFLRVIKKNGCLPPKCLNYMKMTLKNLAINNSKKHKPTYEYQLGNNKTLEDLTYMNSTVGFTLKVNGKVI